MRICHVSSVHSRYDIRIYLKEIQSLRNNGYDVILIVADGKGNEDNNSIIDVGSFKSKLFRILFSKNKLYNKIIKEDFDICHLHDPELLPLGIRLKRRGKIVFFDSHENVSKQLLTKPYLGKIARVILSRLFSAYEKRVLKKYDYIFTATDSISKSIEKINTNVITINNFPLLSELSEELQTIDKSKNEICYIGGITKIRGIIELISSLRAIPYIKLNLAGRFDSESLYDEVRKTSEWSQVNYVGFISRKEVQEILKRSIAGIVNFHPCPNHMEAQPNKIFEYMSAGLPVIISNFPLWEKLIVSENCGICIDPVNGDSLSGAIQYIYDNPHEAEMMGKRGRKAVLEKYNWSIEEQKLLSIYEKIINDYE